MNVDFASCPPQLNLALFAAATVFVWAAGTRLARYADAIGARTSLGGEHVTVTPGLRYEQQTLIGNLEQFTWEGNWTPRVGVVWDPAGPGRMKVFGNWGSHFVNDLAARARSRRTPA